MKARLVTLVLLASVIALVAFDRAPPHPAPHRASISAEHPTVELPTPLEAAPLFFGLAPRALVATPASPLVASVRSTSLYLRNRRLIL